MSGRSRVASSALAATIGIGVQGLAKLLVTVVVGRVFGTETLGQTTALLSLSVFTALLWPNAAGNTASRVLAIALRGRRSDTAVNRLLGASMAVSSVVLHAMTRPVPIRRSTAAAAPSSKRAITRSVGAGSMTR